MFVGGMVGLLEGGSTSCLVGLLVAFQRTGLLVGCRVGSLVRR